MNLSLYYSHFTGDLTKLQNLAGAGKVAIWNPLGGAANANHQVALATKYQCLGHGPGDKLPRFPLCRQARLGSDTHPLCQ